MCFQMSVAILSNLYLSVLLLARPIYPCWNSPRCIACNNNNTNALDGRGFAQGLACCCFAATCSALNREPLRRRANGVPILSTQIQILNIRGAIVEDWVLAGLTFFAERRALSISISVRSCFSKNELRNGSCIDPRILPFNSFRKAFNYERLSHSSISKIVNFVEHIFDLLISFGYLFFKTENVFFVIVSLEVTAFTSSTTE